MENGRKGAQHMTQSKGEENTLTLCDVTSKIRKKIR